MPSPAGMFADPGPPSPFSTAALTGLLLFCLLGAASSSFGVIRDGGVDPANLGQGGWLYLMHSATNHLSPNNISAVTNENSLMQYLKGRGLNYVIVKAGTSNKLWYDTTYSTTSPMFTRNLVNLAHTNGLKIFGSNRSWGNDLPGEARVADYVFTNGADGFIFDAEAEWEANASRPWITNGPAQAWWLCSTIRSNWPTKFIAHNPFDTLYLHSLFPYKEFGYWCDAVMPQVYHHAASQGNAIAAIHWTDVNYRTFQNSLASLPVGNSNGLIVYWTNAIKPLVLMRDVYGANYSTAYPPEDVRNFLDYMVADPNCVTAGGYKGSDYFRSELYDLNQWAYIKAATIGAFSNVVNSIIMDDARITVVGTWTSVKTIDATTGSTVSFTGEFGTDTNSFGTNYFKALKGPGARYMQFTPNVRTGGDYLCYQWHPYRADASSSVPHLIVYNGGITTVYANQQTNAGNWSLLGQFNFAPGSAGYIRITDAILEAGAVALVDGLKLVFVPPTSVPVPPGSLAATAVSTSEIHLAWKDYATNETAYIVASSPTAGGPYINLAVLPRGATNYNQTGLAQATTCYYVVWATNFLGASQTSAEAGATTFDPPHITTQPQGQTVVQGTGATFTIAATGTPPPSYQWRFNGTNLASATTTLLTITTAQFTNAGSYSVFVTNAAGTRFSDDALLAVTQAPPSRIDSITLLSGGQIQLQVNGYPGQYAIEGSTNLADWATLTNFSSTGSSFQYVDPETGQSQRYYRVRRIP